MPLPDMANSHVPQIHTPITTAAAISVFHRSNAVRRSSSSFSFLPAAIVSQTAAMRKRVPETIARIRECCRNGAFCS